MAAVFEAIGFRVRDVGVYDHDADEPGSFVEDLYVQSGGLLADAGLCEGAGLDVVPAEGEGHFGDHVDVREDVGDDVHLGDALLLDFAPVGAPLLVGEVAVDGAVHVAWRFGSC